MRRQLFVAAAAIGVATSAGFGQAPDPWLEVEDDLSVVAIHAIMLPPLEFDETLYAGGLVLYYRRTLDGPEEHHKVAHLWDPVSQQTIGKTPEPEVNLFCAGHAIDYAGRVIFAGGRSGTGCGVDRVTIYDPFTNWMSDAGEMDDGRWYPTVTMDALGEAYFFAGNKKGTSNCPRNLSIERFDPYTPGDPAVVVADVGGNPPNYPLGHLLSDGRMAMVGPPATTQFFDTLDPGVSTGPTTELGVYREAATSVILPIDLRDATPAEEVLLIGGYKETDPLGDPTNTAEILFFDDQAQPPQWDWRYTEEDLTHARALADAVLLANGQVFLIGGGSQGGQGCPIFVPELFDPATEEWTALTSATHTHPRMYHSVALLLMDGSVWTAGQNQDSECPSPCPTCGSGGYWAHGGDKVEIYRPPYFFDASRPEITDSPASVEPEEPFVVEFTVGQGRAFSHAAMISLSAVTHSVNMTQRYLILKNPDPPSGGEVGLDAPPAAYAPPGPYMLVVIDDEGIPSVAKMIYLE